MQEISQDSFSFLLACFSIDEWMDRYINTWKEGYVDKYISKHLMFSSACRKIEVICLYLIEHIILVCLTVLNYPVLQTSCHMRWKHE